MPAIEKPPIMRGSPQEQINSLRDYLFRMVGGLEDVINAASSEQASAVVVTNKDGTKSFIKGKDASGTLEAVRKNAQELKALIVKSAKDLTEGYEAGDAAVSAYADRKTETYDSRYVAQSTFGAFTETIGSVITTTAQGVVESYGYGAALQSIQADIDLIQDYYTTIDGEIRRGIVEDPDTGNYVLGIAISQNLQFSGECGPTDPNNPGDGYIYYYLNSGQTFGLYTSTGWQFWIDGHKKAWLSSVDGILHVANVQVEQTLQIGSAWQITASADGSRFEIRHIGV